MTRKKVITALAAVAAGFVNNDPARAQDETVAKMYALAGVQKHITVHLNMVDEAPDEYGVSAITVSYRGEKITLSAKEIMDAIRS